MRIQLYCNVYCGRCRELASCGICGGTVLVFTCCVKVLHGRTGAGAFCVCWSINSTCSNLIVPTPTAQETQQSIVNSQCLFLFA